MMAAEKQEELGWDWSHIDNRKCLNIQDQKSMLKVLLVKLLLTFPLRWHVFLLFHRNFLEDVIILETNKHLDRKS